MTHIEYDPPIESLLIARLTLGMATEEEIQSIPIGQKVVFKYTLGIGRVPIVFGYLAGLRFLSPFVKNCLEALEPGVHRFLPVNVESRVPINGAYEHGEYYILVPPPLVDCVVIEKTMFAEGYGMEGWVKGLNGSGGGGFPLGDGDPCTLRRQSVAGRHLWRTKISKFDYTMVSDEFWSAICHEPHAWGVQTKCTLTSQYDVSLN